MDIDKFNPMKLGDRSKHATEAAWQQLMLDNWESFGDIVQLMVKATDLQPRSCADIIKGFVARGDIEMRGEWKGRIDTDTREIHLVTDGPPPWHGQA